MTPERQTDCSGQRRNRQSRSSSASRLEPTGKFSGMLLFSAKVELGLKRSSESLEGQAQEVERQCLLAMTDEELIAYLKTVDKEEANNLVNLVPKRAEKLPLGEVMSILTGNDKAAEIFSQLTAFSLRFLLYRPLPEVIKQFQEDIEAEPTGILAFGQFSEAGRRFNHQRSTAVFAFGFEIKVYQYDDYASVDGTWKLDGETIAYPINTSKVTCTIRDMMCRIATANLIVPNLDADRRGRIACRIWLRSDVRYEKNRLPICDRYATVNTSRRTADAQLPKR